MINLLLFISGKIDCGTVDEKKMTIHHYGFGEAMYLVENSTCKAMAGAGHHHFVLNDLMADSCCSKVVHVCFVLKS